MLIVVWICSLLYQLHTIVYMPSSFDKVDVMSSNLYSIQQTTSSFKEESHFFVLAQQPSTNCYNTITNNTLYCCPPPYQGTKRKSMLTAFLLSFFLGVFGADRFYLGFYLMGVIKLLTIGGCGGML